MLKQNKALLIVTICAIAAIAITAIAMLVKDNKDKPKSVTDEITIEDLTEEDFDGELAPAYHQDLTQFSGIYDFWIYFNTEAETYELTINDVTGASGSYERTGNRITVTGKDGNGNEIQPADYLIDGEYLLMASSYLNGTIPEGETFDVVIGTEQLDSTKLSYEFRKDGTVTIISKYKTDKSVIIEGTYTREGDILKIESEESTFAPYIIYHDHLFTSYFVKSEPAES